MRAARTTTARTQRALAAVALFAYAASCRAPPANAPPIDGDEDDEPVAAPPPRVGVPAPAPRCGRERWSVKVGTDADARAVDLAHPREGTIDAMRALPWPDPSVPVTASLPDRRMPPHELVAYRLRDVPLRCFREEPDGDLHLVLGRGDETMIAEIPDPACAPDSPFAGRVRRARETFLVATAGARGRGCHRVGATVTIEGVAFFDRVHHQTGVARENGIELHPVVSICFGHGCGDERPRP